jgi:hypothetical protein
MSTCTSVMHADDLSGTQTFNFRAKQIHIIHDMYRCVKFADPGFTLCNECVRE